MSGEIIVSDALEKLKDEIRILKATLAELLQERDDLIYHIGPELCARYAAEIGDYQNRANYQELMILELKRRIEIAQAALNREQRISEEEVDKRIEKEYQEFHQKVDEEYQKSKKFKEEQAQKEEKRKHYEEQWKKQYSQREEEESTEKKSDTDNSSADNDIKSKEKPLPNAKELYRKIVKKLHPDMNPNATEHDLELFHRATKAHEEGDIMTLQVIYDEIYGLDVEVLAEEESIETLISLREQLLERIRKATEEIEAIKEEFPYTEKEFLDNQEAVKAKQDALIRLIQEYEKEILRLTQILNEVNQKMEDLQKKDEG